VRVVQSTHAAKQDMVVMVVPRRKVTLLCIIPVHRSLFQGFPLLLASVGRGGAGGVGADSNTRAQT